MDALIQIGNLLIKTLFYIYLLAVLLRLILQLTKADFYNPISQALVKITAPPLKPLRRIIPGVFGIDISSIVLAVLIQMLAITLLLLLSGVGFINPLYLLIWAVLACVGLIINIYLFSIFVSIILSWIAPGNYNPAVLLLHQITEPVLAPFRKMLPSLGGLDISPILVIITLKIIEIVLAKVTSSFGFPLGFAIGL